MKKLSFLFVFILFAASAATVNANTSGDQPVFVKEFLGQVEFIEGRLLQLEGAMSQDQMTWAPAEGVRNVATVYLHVAEANYMLVGKITGNAPKGERGEIEKSTTDKNEVAEIMKASFSKIKESAANLTEDDLNKEFEMFGMKFTLRNFMITILNHMHEHLGQGIAYARMNGVTPPWSMKGE
jgi:uncharacterized damage-inducible protein DinB